MNVKQIKTVRFDVLLKQSGKPEQVTLWTRPEDDRDFMKAVHAGRVITLFQHNVGTKKDFGVVGFAPEKNAAFLVFPKTLEPDEGTRVIGIKYERVASEAPRGPIFKPKKRPPGVAMRERPSFKLNRYEGTAKPKQSAKVAKPEPALSRFTATVQLVASQLVEIEVKAATKAEAAKRLAEKARAIEFDPRQADIKRTMKAIKKARAA